MSYLQLVDSKCIFILPCPGHGLSTVGGMRDCWRRSGHQKDDKQSGEDPMQYGTRTAGVGVDVGRR